MTMPTFEKSIFSFNNLLDLKVLKNVAKLSTREQKTLAVLVVSCMELGVLKEEDRDETISSLISSFSKHLPAFEQFDILFSAYFDEKNSKRKDELFKQVKPLESIAMYFSEIAERFNRVPKTTAITKKAFVYNLLLYWFTVENTKSAYFSFLDDFDFQDEIDKLIKESKEIEKTEEGFRKELNMAFDNSIEIAEELKVFTPRIFIPKKKGFRRRSLNSSKQ